MDEIDRAVVNRLQDGFPVCERPFCGIGADLGLSEYELIGRVRHLLEAGVLTRFGPLYNVERAGGAFTLAAIAVPDDDFERVAAVVNAMPEVAHNYRREHALNMWFVLATETPGEIGRAVGRIERETGYRVVDLPKEREYFVGLRLEA